MKYFIVKPGEDCKFVPAIKNQAICNELEAISQNRIKMMQFPNHLTIPVNTTEQTVWADVLSIPAFLFSKEFLNVVKRYGDPFYCREVILLDQKNAKSKLYSICKFEQTEGQMTNQESMGKEQSVVTLSHNPRINQWSNIFQVKFEKASNTIINLDLTESLLRRNLDGIGLEEVRIDGI